LETVGQSLRHSCGTPIKCQGISLPLDRQSYSRRLLGVTVKAKTFSIKLAAPGRRQSLYFFFQIRRDLCFILNSRCPRFCDSFFRLKPKKATPYPEVTESFCRVPSIQLTQAP